MIRHLSARGGPRVNRVLSAIDKGRRTAWGLSVFTFMLVVVGTTASGEPPLVPDPQLTPGATLEVTTSDICVPGYTKKVRSVPAAVKQQVYAAYGIQDHAPGDYEIDHLIPLYDFAMSIVH
jgi:hypothetical protein